MILWQFIKEIYSYVDGIFVIISHTSFWGIPLNTTLHVVVGFLVTVIGLKLKFKFFRIFIFLLIIESLKAIHGALSLNYDIYHGMKEFFATFVYPALLWLVRKFQLNKDKKLIQK